MGDGPMVVSSQESTMVMVSYQDMEPLATEQSTLAIMDSIILASVRPRLNHTPSGRFTLDFPFTTLPLMVVFTTQVRSPMLAIVDMDWVTMAMAREMPMLMLTPLAKFMPVFQLTTPMLPDTTIMLDTSAM